MVCLCLWRTHRIGQVTWEMKSGSLQTKSNTFKHMFLEIICHLHPPPMLHASHVLLSDDLPRLASSCRCERLWGLTTAKVPMGLILVVRGAKWQSFLERWQKMKQVQHIAQIVLQHVGLAWCPWAVTVTSREKSLSLAAGFILQCLLHYGGSVPQVSWKKILRELTGRCETIVGQPTVGAYRHLFCFVLGNLQTLLFRGKCCWACSE